MGSTTVESRNSSNGSAGFAFAGVAAAASPAAPITATTLFTGTVSPSLTRISETTPAAGDGISASTLSVEISNSGSSRSTLSPTFLIQRTIVPSAIDSPICGITTSVAISPRASTNHQVTRDGSSVLDECPNRRDQLLGGRRIIKKKNKLKHER